MSAKPRVLFISADSVGERMAGLGIRYTELARVLAQHAEVTVAHGGEAGAEVGPGINTLTYRPHAPQRLRGPIAAADVVICHPQWPVVNRWLRDSDARVVIDLYDPEALETLELLADRRMAERRLMDHLALDRLRDALRTGHHFLCASEKQRDLWTGAMLGLGLIDPARHDRDPALAHTFAIVPFGVSADPPAPSDAPGPRERFPELAGSELILWNGGLWRWLDAPTAIRAVVALRERRPRARLLFMGGSTQAAALEATRAAEQTARDAGALGTTVVFNDGWVPYAQRARWLTQADCALSTHSDHLEARYAFRTRLLDCFWSGLPVVCTRGDSLADRVERDALGAVAAPGDPHAVADALERVLDAGKASFGPALASAAAGYAWPRVAAPLVKLLDAPPPAPPSGPRPAAGERLRTGAYVAFGRRALDRRAG